MSKSRLLFVILVLLATFGSQVALGQVPCGTYKTTIGAPAPCVSQSVLVGKVGAGPVQTRIDVTNTTGADLWYRFDYNRVDGFGQHLMTTQNPGDVPMEATGEQILVAAGKARAITISSTLDGSEATFWIRAYVYAPTAELLDAQKDSAIKSTIAYAPEVVTVALPWSFFVTAVRESSLRSAVAGSVKETPTASVVTVMDRHNIFLLVNTGRDSQQVRVTIMDSNGNVLAAPVLTRPLGREEMYDLTYLSSIFGADTFANGGQFRVLFEGLGGYPIFVQNLELIGGPYAVNTTPTWAVGN